MILCILFREQHLNAKVRLWDGWQPTIRGRASLWTSRKAELSTDCLCAALTHTRAIEGREASIWQTNGKLDNVAADGRVICSTANTGLFTA